MPSTPNPQGLPPPEWIYDRFMSVIEPELTSARLPYLDMEYKGETAEEHGLRMERYGRAFRTFGDLLKEFSGYLYVQAQEIQTHRRNDRVTKEEGERVWQLKMADELLGADAASSRMSV